jgi:tRNA-specific 2-thiouridylase
MVRDVARRLDLVTADKPESQEICFIPDDDYRGFLRRRIPTAFRRGPIVDGQGQVLGEHDGLVNFTIGQRRGLGLSLGRALYVTALDPAKNAVVVGAPEELEVERFIASDVNLIAVDQLTAPRPVNAKIRHSHEPVAAMIEPRGPGQVEVRFATPQRAVTPGQSVVFYEGDLVIGGGVIARAEPESA